MTQGPQLAVRRLPSVPGVYRFRDANDRVLYVGRAVDLRRRAASYWTNLGDRVHLAPMVAQVRQVEALACDSAHEAAWLERNVLERSLPIWNRTRGGQEVPAYICLDAGRSSPRLDVHHEPRHTSRPLCFGPYLGGLKVRLAVAGLRRAYPVSYTGEGISGSALDMARIRGITASDREDLASAIAAVLTREPTAMNAFRGELLQRRDQAASRLDFELAARIQAEIEAAAWVLSEQKATAPDVSDLDIYGWANGRLLRLTIRSGRLSDWTNTECERATAEARLQATPNEWRPFANRNAVLAATLLHSPENQPGS